MAGLLPASELADITAVVASSLDVTLPQYRPTTSQDGYGHTVYTYPSTATAQVACNVSTASASLLQAYATVIGSQRAVKLRVMQTTDVKQMDRFVYDGVNWNVHERLNAESYTVTNEYLLISVV